MTVPMLLLSFSLVSLLLPSSTTSFSTFHLPVHTLLLCRHGDSIWNGGQSGCEERFTGWTNVELSEKGTLEAVQAATQLASYFYNIDLVFTSMLQRALDTTHACWTQLSQQQSILPPICVDYRLAERHYGALQGLVKKDVEEGKYGHDRELVEQWRRSWYAVPPMLEDSDERRIQELHQYSEICGGGHNVPKGESLEMVAKNRIRPLLDQVITPALDLCAMQKGQIRKEKRPEQVPTAGLVVAHANSLRALIGVVCEVEEDPIALRILESLRIPTGVPLVIHFQKLSSGRYKACRLPEPEECLIQDQWGYFNKPKEAPPNLGHPLLPVWPLNTCIPLESKNRQEFFAAFEP